MDYHYFTRVIPPRTGFSPYHSPGWAVQLPIMLMALYWGLRLCAAMPWLGALAIIYVVAGTCLGRDLAVIAHYNPFITLATWAAFLAHIIYIPKWELTLKKWQSAQPHWAAATAIAISIVLAALLCRGASRWGRPAG